MKVTKKLLSVFLAVLMIMSSMSVCFGTFVTASAANLNGDYSSYTQDPFSYLATHLNGQTITDVANSVNIGNGGSGGTGSNTTAVYYTTNITLATYEQFCEVRDVLIYLDKAIKGSSPWGKTVNTQDSQTGACAGAQDIYDDVVKRIEKYETLTSQGKEFIKYVLDYSKARHHDNAEKITKSWGRWGSVSKTPTSHQTTVNISTSDYKGYLAEAGEHTNVATNIELGYTYNFYMRGDLYYSTHNIIGSENGRYYHHMVWLSSNPINAPSVNKSDTTTKTKLNTFVNTVDNTITANTFDVMAAMSLAEIEALEKKLDDARTTVKAYVNNDGLDNYATLFPGYDDKIATFKETAAKAKEIAKYKATVAEITDYQTNNSNYGVFNWGAFDEATIKADYADFMGKYGSIINDATLYDYFVRQGSISDTYVTNFYDNFVAYDLEDLRLDEIDPLYNEYALSFPMEGGEEATLEAKSIVYGLITGYIGNIYSYSDQVQKAIFPVKEGGINYLLDFQEKLECQVSDCVVYFAQNVNKDYSDATTEEVIAEIATAKAQLAALNALNDSIDYQDNRTLLTPIFEYADTFIAYLYSLLAERFTAQVDVADEAYTALERPSSLDLSAFSKLNVYLSAIEETILTYIDGEGKGALITVETRAKYDALKAEVFPAFDAFLVDRGFNEYETNDILIRREDDPDEFFRANENLDDDILGEYEVTDENVEEIIELLEAALKDETIAGLLGSLINKDEDGNPTGEAFDLAALLNGLIEGIYSDDLINTIISFIYPAVANIFSNVWVGINPVINDSNMDVMGQKVAVYAVLDLFTVEQATAGLGVPLFPKELAEKIRTTYPAFANVADVLDDATTKAIVTLDANGNPIEETRKSPWNDAVLYTEKLDKDGNVVTNEETGEATMVLNLDWGIDELEGAAKRERFLDAAQAALCGLEPLLLAILCNKEMKAFNSLIGTGEGELDNFYVDALGGMNLWDIALDVYQIDLALNASANDGYNNVIAPLFEMLNVTAPNGRNFTSVRQVLKEGLFDPLDAFIAKLDANPLKTILDLLPNLAYAAEADLLLTKLNYLGTTIDYHAGAYIDADVNVAQTDYWLEVPNIIDRISGIVSGLVGLPMEDGVIKGVRLDDVVNGEMPVEISSFLDINALLGDGVDLSSFAGIWNLIAGLVPMLANVPVFDASYLATLGTLTERNTVRSIKAYTAGTAGKAYYIEANRADVLQYLIKWLLESGLLNGIVKNPDELVAGIFANLQNNSGDAVAAIVELLNQQVYPAKTYSWFDGTVDGESVVGNSADEIYLNPNNDWTEEKAQYLYDNLEALLVSIFTMANLDLDKETEGVQTSLEDLIGGLVNGLFTDKTLTALAGLLAKLDLNALTAPEADEEATVAEGEAEAAAIDLNALVKDLLGIDLAAVAAQYADTAAALEADPEYVDHSYGVDAAEDKAAAFVNGLVEMLEPLSVVLDFILAGENLEITIGTEKVTLLGGEGYTNGLVPLLEALGCEVAADPENALEATLNALVGLINKLTTNDPAVEKDGFIYGVIDLIPGLFYYIASNGLATSVMNLLQPVLVIVDTIRPIIDVMDLIGNIEIGEEGAKQSLKSFLGFEEDEKLSIKRLDLAFIMDLVPALLPENLGIISDLLEDILPLIYDLCLTLGTPYTSAAAVANTVDGKAKKGAFNDNFTQADLLTVLLSFILEWATVEENAEALDELLNTNGIIASLNTVFADVEITYGTPNWGYWFENQDAFDAYLANPSRINTLASLDWENIGDNDWDQATALYFAENLDVLVDTVIAMINKDKADAPQTLAELLGGLVNGLVNADTLNDLVGMLAGLLEGVDDNLLELAGYILGDSSTDKKEIDIVGLKSYTCEAEINSISDFINELANVLDTYASGLVDWLFFGNDFRFAKKSVADENGEYPDTIVINGGEGYAQGLAMILEALGCELPEEANTKSVLGALAARVDAILADPIDEVIALLPNLVYFLNANGAGVAVDNLLKPVNALLTKLQSFGLNVNLNELIGIDLANLSLANVVAIVEGATGLTLDAAENILVNFCTGKISKGEYIYKMEAAPEDTITILLVVVFELLYDDTFAAQLDAMLDLKDADGNPMSIVATIKEIIAGAEPSYKTPEWNYMRGQEKDGVIEYVNKITEYPNDWTEDKAEYLAENLPALVDTVIKMIEINGVKYESLSALLKANVNIFTSKTLDDIVGILKNLLGGIDEELLKVGFLLDVKLVDVKDEEGNVVVPGLMSYTAPEGITTVDAFAAELANVLSTYAPGVVEWLLLGRDFNLLVKDADGIEEGLVANGSYVTIKGAQGYAEGLALLLEALGCENLPEVYNVENLDTAATVKAVLDSLAARIDEIFANPVKEVLDLLPNLIYFLDADGVDAVINNTTAALMALVGKLSVFGINLDINVLVDLPELMGIADKYAEGDDKVALDNLTLKALLKAVSLMTGLDLTELEDVLYPFALGEAVKYDSVSANDAYKMQYKNDYDKHDMITVLVTAVLRVAFETEGNAEVLADLLGTDIISSIEEVFASVEITYSKPNWDYNLADNGTVDAMKYAITYPNNWSEATAEYVTTTIMSKEFDALVAGLIDSNYASLSDLLNDKVNVFTSENLDAIVKLIADLLKDIDDGLLAAAGVILDVNVVGLKSYKAPEGITTVKAFAAELANILNTYAPGVVEWLLLGEDYRFFVNKEADGETVKYVDFITINGAEGYANGLALLLEALGCKDLPAADGDTKAIVEGVLTSLANRIDEIFANPVKEVVNLLPNLLYFLNTNGVAAVIDNTIAALTALLGKLETFGVKLDINELVNLKKLMKIEDTDATISLDNLAMADLLQAVGYMTGLNLSLVEDVLVNFGLVKAEAYASVSDKTAVGEAKKMGYEEDVFETHDMVTVLANLVLLTLVAEDNAEFVKGLVGEDIYQVILNLLNMQEAEIQEFSWMYTDRVGETFSTLETSGLYDDWPLYGPLYTEEMATYIADNFGEFVDNILYLLGLEINGVQINDLTTLINELLDGSLYNSSNVIAIRDALAGVLAKVENLEVKGVVVGGYIADVLKAAGIADIKAVANVNVPEFEKNKEMFVASLCDVLEPLYGILKFVLANEDISFFVDLDKNDLITLNGGEGYAYGIVPLLEVLGCENILTPDAYYAAVKADGDVLLTSILDPLLKRVDVIIADPANEILAILPNIIYFINSNGLDTVVKNTLNAVYSILGAIEPIAKIDLYELIGVDLSKINMNWLVDKLLGILADAGYDFDLKDIDPIAELTVGTLEQYTSLNGKTAYRMVYTPDGSIEGSSAELVTVILRLLVTFLMHEKNAEIVVDFLSDNLGMSPDAKDYIDGVIKAIAKVPTTTYLGMDQALAVIYYLFYGADIGSGALAGGLKDINAEWQNIMKELGKSDDPNEQTIGNILAGLMKDFDTEDVLGEDGVATNGLISFFQKIADWFNKIIEWFKNLFN